MDSFSGSEPRKLISIRLGNENEDQPQQTLVEDETTTIPKQPEANETQRLTTPDEMHTRQESMDQGSSQQQAFPNLSLISRLFATDSSGSNESYGTYITCKMSQLEEAAAKEFTEVTEGAERESVSEPLAIARSVQPLESNNLLEPSRPVVIFLDSPRQVIDNPELEYSEPAAKRSRSVSPSGSSTAEAALRCNMPVEVTRGTQKRPNNTDKRVTTQPPTANYSDTEFGHISGCESE